MKTEGPPRYYVGIFPGRRDDPLTWIGGPRGYVERTREEAEAKPMVFIEDLETERTEKP